MEPQTPQTQTQEHLATAAHRLTHLLFVIGMAMKGIFGILDTVAGFLFFSTSAITNFIVILTEHELGEDPFDFFANKIFEVLPYFSIGTQLFVAWYFLIHGILNIVLVISLLRRKLWAYPTYITVLCLFAAYQVYRFTHTHSLTLLIVTFFDAVMIALIWREYQFVRQRYETRCDDAPAPRS